MEYGQKSVPELTKIFVKDNRFKNRKSETIRGAISVLQERNLVENSCDVDATQGNQEKKFNLTNLGFEWFLQKFKIDSKIFWRKLLDVGLISNDYHYTTKKKVKIQ